ncbi:TetR/AcrR family transcriptional regulator [Aquabacterium sp.]|uniref:TetR/AcrR family transcriptional regulator n=1 Tax=Aquabacterium sp. TaxID=1872578 RepID=UPI002CCCEAD2|nr:TetR/AcrR family transcriptional regulator [Aquabacterium sp.]HSW05151.1 TetR/AcrR family transcriptional regulator [Aquabacterium sp.]
MPSPSAKSASVAAPAKRRTQEDRTREARLRLREATIAVLVERGYAGLTTKEVVVRAGVSNGALMHHYASKMELVIDATADIYEAAIERGQRIARTPAAHRDPVGGFIKDCMSVYFEWPFIAALEVLMVARTDTELMPQILPVMQRYRSLTNELWLEVFVDTGVPRPQAETVLNLTLNLVRGMAVNSIWQKDMKSYKAQLSQWAEVARGMLSRPGRPASPSQTGDNSRAASTRV